MFTDSLIWIWYFGSLWNPTFAKVARTHAKMEKRKPNLFFVKIDIGFTSNELRQKLANKIRGLPFVSVLPKTPVKSTRFDVEEKNSYYNILDGDVAFAVWVNGKADVHVCPLLSSFSRFYLTFI